MLMVATFVPAATSVLSAILVVVGLGLLLVLLLVAKIGLLSLEVVEGVVVWPVIHVLGIISDEVHEILEGLVGNLPAHDSGAHLEQGVGEQSLSSVTIVFLDFILESESLLSHPLHLGKVDVKPLSVENVAIERVFGLLSVLFGIHGHDGESDWFSGFIGGEVDAMDCSNGSYQLGKLLSGGLLIKTLEVEGFGISLDLESHFGGFFLHLPDFFLDERLDVEAIRGILMVVGVEGFLGILCLAGKFEADESKAFPVSLFVIYHFQ